jgi:hypothetical protein
MDGRRVVRYVYVVEGSSGDPLGEYSDHTEWMVKAFTTEDAAKRFITKCSKRANELQAQYSSTYDMPKGANEYDPEMQVDYTGVNYGYAKVELVGKLEKAGKIEEEINDEDKGRRIIL